MMSIGFCVKSTATVKAKNKSICVVVSDKIGSTISFGFFFNAGNIISQEEAVKLKLTK